MKQTRSYVDMLVNSLEKKRYILGELNKLQKKQDRIFTDSKSAPEDVENLLDEQKRLIDKLEELDLGFEKLYERVKIDIEEDKDSYREEIIKMQDIIRDISSVTVSLQAAQTRNKEKYASFFNSKREEVKQFKMSNKTVSNYYKNMYNSHQEGSSYFLDKKK